MGPSVLDHCPLTELSTCRQAAIKISIASVILRGTVITFIKERCAWDSGSEIAVHTRGLMGTQDLFQYPGSLLKKFLKLKLKKALYRRQIYSEFLYRGKLILFSAVCWVGGGKNSKKKSIKFLKWPRVKDFER